MVDLRQHAPSAARNREPILDVLTRVLPNTAEVLEVASGSGEHAIYFASARSGWRWTPSDPDSAARASIAAWIEGEGVPNLAAPLALDAASPDWPVADGAFDAIVCINMIHISPWEATLGLMAGAARTLRPAGLLCTYGAYKRDGRHTAPSNEHFDVWLKGRDPRFGVRDLAAVETAANEQGLSLREVIEMPANNLSLVFVHP